MPCPGTRPYGEGDISEPTRETDTVTGRGGEMV